MDEGIQLIVSGRLHTMKTLLAIVIFGIGTIEKEHVVMHIEIQRGAKALDQGD